MIASMPKKIRKHLHHCAKSVTCVTGVVFIWYGIWWCIDFLQEMFFPEQEALVALSALVIGFGILYLPDRDLDELL